MDGKARRRSWEITTPKGSLAVVEAAVQMAQGGLAQLGLWVHLGELTPPNSTNDWPEQRNMEGLWGILWKVRPASAKIIHKPRVLGEMEPK